MGHELDTARRDGRAAPAHWRDAAAAGEAITRPAARVLRACPPVPPFPLHAPQETSQQRLPASFDGERWEAAEDAAYGDRPDELSTSPTPLVSASGNQVAHSHGISQRPSTDFVPAATRSTDPRIAFAACGARPRRGAAHGTVAVARRSQWCDPPSCPYRERPTSPRCRFTPIVSPHPGVRYEWEPETRHMKIDVSLTDDAEGELKSVRVPVTTKDEL